MLAFAWDEAWAEEAGGRHPKDAVEAGEVAATKRRWRAAVAQVTSGRGPGRVRGWTDLHGVLEIFVAQWTDLRVATVKL